MAKVREQPIIYDRSNLGPDMHHFKATMHERLNMGFADEFFMRPLHTGRGGAQCVFCGNEFAVEHIDTHYVMAHQITVVGMYRRATRQGFVPCPNEKVYLRLKADPAPFFLCCMESMWGGEVVKLGKGGTLRLFIGILMVQDWFAQADRAFGEVWKTGLSRQGIDDLYSELTIEYRTSLEQAAPTESLLALTTMIGMLAQEKHG